MLSVSQIGTALGFNLFILTNLWLGLSLLGSLLYLFTGLLLWVFLEDRLPAVPRLDGGALDTFLAGLYQSAYSSLNDFLNAVQYLIAMKDAAKTFRVLYYSP